MGKYKENKTEVREQWLGKVRVKHRFRGVVFGLRVIKKAIRGYSFAGYSDAPRSRRYE